MCLAERYEGEDCAVRSPRCPLEQMSRLGSLLSRFIVFLTARQQVRAFTCRLLFGGLV